MADRKRLPMVLAAAAAAALVLVPSAAHGAYGLAGEWLLDDGDGPVVGDSSGAGQDGRLAASPGTPLRIPGLAGQALHFDGNDEVVMPDSPRLEPPRLT